MESVPPVCLRPVVMARETTDASPDVRETALKGSRSAVRRLASPTQRRGGLAGSFLALLAVAFLAAPVSAQPAPRPAPQPSLLSAPKLAGESLSAATGGTPPAPPRAFVPAGEPPPQVPRPALAPPAETHGGLPASGEPAAAPAVIRRTSGDALPAATIVLDPGHGGSDTGIIGPGGTREKNVALQLAKEIQRELQTRFGLRVVLTREGDYAMSAQERVARANSLHASLYLSLHMKGGRSADVQGTDIIVAPPAEAVSPTFGGGAASKTGGAIEVKVRGEVLRLQPWELLPAAAATTSRRLAAALLEAFRAANPFYPVRLLELPVVQLLGVQAPAVLVEAAALVSPAEEVKLQNVEFLRELARILAAGIVQLLGAAS